MRRLIFIITFLSFGLAIHAQQLNVATYNIRNANATDSANGNGWHNRCPIIGQLIMFNDFDIVGLQEVLDGQRIDIMKILPEYNHVGVGRDNGKTKGEYASIIYKRDKFEELQSGHFWLSENTDYPNIGWDAKYPRICTWIQLKDKNSGKIIWFYNLHLDHIGKIAREESCKLVLRKMKERSTGDFCILTGDFNVNQHNKIYNILADSDFLNDSYQVCKIRYATNGTFNGFDPYYYSDGRIDHVFVSNNFCVDRYGILTDIYHDDKDSKTIRLASDHFPVVVKLSYK